MHINRYGYPDRDAPFPHEYDERTDGRTWPSGHWVAADLPAYDPVYDDAEERALAAIDAERPADEDSVRDDGRDEVRRWMSLARPDLESADPWLWTGLDPAEAAAMAQRLRDAGCHVLTGDTHEMGGPSHPPDCSPTWHAVIRSSLEAMHRLGTFVGIQAAPAPGERPLVLANCHCGSTVSRELADDEIEMVRKRGNAQQRAAVGAP